MELKVSQYIYRVNIEVVYLTQQEANMSDESDKTLCIAEKKALQSKKFLAWLIQQLLMTGMAVVALIKQESLGWPLSSFMGGIVFMMGISTMWYLGKQAAVDSVVRGYAFAGDKIEKLRDKVAPD
jgi:hypothetical protein